jgi:fluoroquinolone transport system permease protein
MMQALLAFSRNDWLLVRRDSLLFFVLAIPWLMTLLLRLLLPDLTSLLRESSGFDLVPYYVLIASFLMIQFALMMGVLLGLIALDERDDNVLTALRVTPLSLRRYAGYRVVVSVLLSVLSMLVLLPLTGLLSQISILALLPVAMVAGLLAPVMGVFLVAFANNKLEGLALMKALGLFVLGPLAAYFLAEPWQWLVGIIPSYWVAKALWETGAGGMAWPYLLIGAVYSLLLTGWLVRRWLERSNQPRSVV